MTSVPSHPWAVPQWWSSCLRRAVERCGLWHVVAVLVKSGCMWHMNHAKPPWHVVAWLHCIAWSQVLRKNIRGMADGILSPIPGTIEHLSNRLCSVLFFFGGIYPEEIGVFQASAWFAYISMESKDSVLFDRFKRNGNGWWDSFRAFVFNSVKYTIFLHNSSLCIVDTLSLLYSSI